MNECHCRKVGTEDCVASMDGYYAPTANDRITTGYCNLRNEWPWLE